MSSDEAVAVLDDLLETLDDRVDQRREAGGGDAIDAVLAWRIQLMTLLSREVPDLPCTVFFDACID